MKQIFILCLFALGLSACNTDQNGNANGDGGADNNADKSTLTIGADTFGQVEGADITRYTLENEAGMAVSVIDYGGIITSIMAPDKNGRLGDVVLGFDDVGGYVSENPYFGAFIGRYGNRIAKGKFTLDGEEYTLATNNGPNSLHGGVMGFNKKKWTATPLEESDRVGVKISGTSPDGEEGYPGNLDVSVTYWLNNDNELIMEYAASTDAATPVNVTNHSYFNLRGAGNGDILGHELMINASKFTPVDETLIPIGQHADVNGTPFDFTEPTPIGERVEADDEQIEFGGGYDHNFVLDRTGSGMSLAATVYEPTTGRTLEVETTEPGLQFYCGNFLDGSNIGKGDKPYDFRTGFCLETQHFPDSPNQPSFPSTILQPGEKYASRTIYRFGVRND